MNILARHEAPSSVMVEGILDALPDLVCQFLPDMTLTYVNARFCRMFGRNEAELIGSSVADLVAIEHKNRLATTLDKLSLDNREVALDHRTLGMSGNSLWQCWTISAQFDAAGAIVGYLAIIRDVTETRCYQDALEALMDLVTERHMTVDQSIDAVLDIGRRFYGADSGIVCQFDDGVCTVRNSVSTETPSAQHEQCDADKALGAIVQQAGGVVSVSHLAESEYGGHGFVGECGIGSFIGAPIHVLEAHYGVISFSTVTTRQQSFTAQEENFLKVAAHWLSIEIERHENRTESERHDHELQFIFDQLPARIWYKDEANRIVRLNQTAARFIGVEPSEAVGRHVNELFSDETRQYHEDDLHVLGTAEPSYGVLEDMTSEVGKRNWARVDKIPNHDERTGDRHLLVVANDVTEAVRYRNALEELMALVNQGHNDPGETLRCILEIGCRYYKLKLGLVSRTENGVFHEEHILALDEVTEARAQLDLARNLFQATAEAEAPLIFYETDADEFPDRAEGARHGLRCFIGARIVVSGRDYGVLSFACVESRDTEFGDDEVNFIKLMALWVAMEIERHQTLSDLHNSEMNLRFIFDNVPTRIIFKDDANRILRLNASAAHSMGISVEEAEGADTYELFPEMARKYHDDDLAIFESGQPSLGIIEKYTPRDSAAGWVQTDKIPYFDEGTGERRLLVVISDITPLKEAEEALRGANAELRRQQEYFQALYRRTPAMMHSIDHRGRIVEVSDKWLEKLGYSRHEVIGRPSSDFLDEESRRRAVEEILPAFFATGQADNINYQFVARDGSEISIELSAIQDRDGPYGERSLAVLDDVSQRKQAQAALEQRNDELEIANENLKQFAYVAAHDLQEPLRKIQTFSDFVRSAVTEGNEDDIEYGVGVLIQSATRSRQLVSDLLAFSRTTNQVIECHPTQIAEVVNEVLESLQVQIEETGAQIAVDVADATLNADRGLLTRLILNLVSNAMKYQQQGRTPEITVGVETGSDGGPAAIVVTDNGIGFDPKFSDLIFKPFKRLHTRDEFQGTGIGLAICATAARRHGWSLTADSQPGKGSTFRINLIGTP